MSTQKQIRRSQVEIKVQNLDVDKITVERILLAAKDRFDLFDNTHTSRIPDTIKSIIEGDGYGFGLGSRVVGDSIFVDFNRLKAESPKFNEVHQFILAELKTAFQCDLQEAFEDNPAYCRTH